MVVSCKVFGTSTIDMRDVVCALDATRCVALEIDHRFRRKQDRWRLLYLLRSF